MAIFFAMALSCLCASDLAASLPQKPERTNNDSLTVSLITCYPGPEIYELYGHEAIRVKGLGRDSVWNFGIFDFREPTFVYRFVKGETDYMAAGYPFEWFLPEYIQRGSKVVEQELNLSQGEARKLLSMFQTTSLPQNRRYRYNYVKNNCATRIWQLLDSATTSRIIYPDSAIYGSFRNEMRAYNRNYPWYQFGIDLALGSGIDYRLKAKEEMFVPVEMMRMTDGARLADGRRLVKATRVLNEGLEDATLPATPWYEAPLFWACVMLVICVGISICDTIRKRVTRIAYSVWFAILGIAGCVIAFLVFVSSHEATSPNILILWMNPLQLVLVAVMWWRIVRPLAIALACYNVVACICLLVVWPFQHQSGNPAFFPLIAATLIMAASYAIISWKQSYNNNGLPSAATAKSAGKKGVAAARRTTAKKKDSIKIVRTRK